jgi:glycerophosphoryl diester phosphodiesterase
VKPEVIAHRGNSQHHRENTWAAFLAAQAAGADAIECDIQSTADGQLIVRHDLYIDGRRVSEIDKNELRRLDPDVVRACELIDWAQSECIGLLIEMKDTMSVDLLPRQLVGSRTDGLVFGSFNGPNLLALCEKVGSLKTSLMIGSVMGADEMAYLAERYRCDGLHPCWEHRDPYPHSLMDREQVSALQDRGLKVTLWHEEREEQLERLVGLAPDAICTNDPATLRRVVDGSRPSVRPPRGMDRPARHNGEISGRVGFSADQNPA